MNEWQRSKLKLSFNDKNIECTIQLFSCKSVFSKIKLQSIENFCATWKEILLFNFKVASGVMLSADGIGFNGFE